MQQHPNGWKELFSVPHKTEYKYTVDGVDYIDTDIKGTPVILKPLMENPSIGACQSGTLTATIRKKPGMSIPKAAKVLVYCRLTSKDGSSVTDWVPQGEYRISQRSGTGDLIQMTCRDLMLLAGRPYLGKTTFNEWPVPMESVVSEIASIMGVTVDPRTVIRTGGAYMVDRPNEDTLMSEVLSSIAAAHCGNWIMTETAQLRLIPFSSTGTPAQEIGSRYKSYTPLSLTQHISRITLEDSAGNQFSVGDDTGTEIAAACEYVTQQTLNNMLDGAEVRGCTLYKVPDRVSGTTFFTDAGTVEGGTYYAPPKAIDITFNPYELAGAYIDPCLELGDTVSIIYKGNEVTLILASISIRCNQSFNADVSFRIDNADEDEFPYTDLAQLEASRYVSTAKSYYGNKLNRTDGFISERILGDGTVAARMIANADLFAMQQLVGETWEDRIYFDTLKRKYRISGDVEIEGAVTFRDLENPQEETFIDGANIKTGTLSASGIKTGTLESQNGVIKIDLDKGKMTIGSEDAEKVFAKVDNAVTLLATSQMFTKTGDATQYTPASITLTAQTSGDLNRYKWYKDDVEISGKTSSTLSITPSDISGDAATYKVIAFDASENEYVDFITIAKVADGKPGDKGDPGGKGDPGDKGDPGADGKPGTDGYTVVLGDEYIQVSVDAKNKPNEDQTYTCTVNVFKGTVALTPTTGAPSTGQFRVSAEGSYPGIAVSQPKAGTISITVTTGTAIGDLTKILLRVTTDIGSVLSTYINVAANLNSVVTKNVTDIKLLEDEVSVRIQEVETSVTNLQESTDTKVSELRQNTDSLTATVGELSETTKKSVDGLNDEVNILSQRVSASLTKEDVQIEIEKQMGNVDSVTTKTGFTFNEIGLTVGKSDSEMATTILDDGMRVKRNGDDVLVANSQGVDAENLHATTYLIVGRNSRFEDYGDRTGCFWIGQGG